MFRRRPETDPTAVVVVLAALAESYGAHPEAAVLVARAVAAEHGRRRVSVESARAMVDRVRAACEPGRGTS